MVDDSTPTSPHPKQLAVPLPEGFKVERTEQRFKISGPVGRWFAFLNRITVTVEAGQLEVRQGWLRPRIFQINASNIEQLYVKEGYGLSETEPDVKLNHGYHLYLITREGRYFPLLVNLLRSDQALYLEQELEHYLGLADREITHISRQVYKGQPKEEDPQAAWQALAATHNLTFTPRNVLKGGYISGQYRGHYLELDSLSRKQGDEGETSTRLLVLANRKPGSTPRADETVLAEFKALLDRPLPSFPLKGVLQFEPGGRAIRYEQPGLETRESVLQFLFDALAELVKLYPEIVALGGKVIPLLQEELDRDKRPFHPIARRLLHTIAEETTTRLAAQAPVLRCDDCLGKCVAHLLRLSEFYELTYYGCRSCFQSRSFIQLEGQIIAVLDNRLETEREWQSGQLRVNWLVRRKPFSFDTVEIIQATDEEVERFVVQVGNDTDPIRQPRYGTLPCRISAVCPLSQNTLRILERTFGRVKLIS